ncbi:barstar family protein [Gilliamella sp. ESL0441]|uniref:barstar family protein n=1 Tax=Gilliamella sp. ESL0441 TaxID=2704654 RepID=UPI001C6955EC|nr:barstar family protein [Gilliamella sp. ESL0441]QYN45510.1 barstar family protein [Gilliamella sp. ESL0441]
MGLNFKFIEGSASYNTAEVFFARIDPTIASTDELLKSIYYLLWFPGYFGFNWNALEDCLTDFNWLSESKIVIAHDNIPKIDERDLQIYLEILNSSVLDWKQNDQHDLEVVFQKKDEKLIQKLLSL